MQKFILVLFVGILVAGQTIETSTVTDDVKLE